jgi:hypothetical protein
VVSAVRDITKYTNPSTGKPLYCAASYAIAAVEATEGFYGRGKGMVIPLSVQQVMDCSSDPKKMAGNEPNDKCEGGQLQSAFDYMISGNNVYSESDYPFTAVNDICKNVAKPSYSSRLASYHTVKPGDPHAVKVLLQSGPVAASISASSPIFRFYSMGVIDDVVMENYTHL